MVRLDSFLVERKYIPSRSRAKRAILYGLIKVNGKIQRKPARNIKNTDQIEVINKIATKPVGYWKLHAILELLGADLIDSKDVVLDLGSSAGGFLEFAAQRCQKVYGIEISEQFVPILKNLQQNYLNITLLITDVFTFNPSQDSVLQPVDLILNDLTLNPIESTKILFKFLPLLKKRGYIIMSIKLGIYSPRKCRKYLETKFDRVNLSIIKILNIDPEKKEIHVVAQKQ